jgi:hypothetical protein
VLLALSLFTSAATAHAECAWVLWVQRVGHSELGPMDAYPTKQDCERDVPRTGATEPPRGLNIGQPEKGSSHENEREPRHRGPAWAEGQVNDSRGLYVKSLRRDKGPVDGTAVLRTSTLAPCPRHSPKGGAARFGVKRPESAGPAK